MQNTLVTIKEFTNTLCEINLSLKTRILIIMSDLKIRLK